MEGGGAIELAGVENVVEETRKRVEVTAQRVVSTQQAGLASIDTTTRRNTKS